MEFCDPTARPTSDSNGVQDLRGVRPCAPFGPQPKFRARRHSRFLVWLSGRGSVRSRGGGLLRRDGTTAEILPSHAPMSVDKGGRLG